jgi:hypothetical protein
MSRYGIAKTTPSNAPEEISKQKLVADSVDSIGGILLECSAAKCCAVPS